MSDGRQSGAAVRTLTGHMGRMSSIGFSPNRKHLVSGSRGNTAHLWEVFTGTVVRTPTRPNGGVTSVTFSPDRRTVASGSQDNSLWLWDVQTRTTLHTLANLG